MKTLQIAKYIKAFISGMMGKPEETLSEVVARLRQLPRDREIDRLQELERIQPKRKGEGKK